MRDVSEPSAGPSVRLVLIYVPLKAKEGGMRLWLGIASDGLCIIVNFAWDSKYFPT